MTAPVRHPSWCDRQHAPEWTTHTVQVGGDIEVTADLTYAVIVWETGAEPTEVQILRHTPEETEVTNFSILQAAILRDLLGEAVGLVAREAGLR